MFIIEKTANGIDKVASGNETEIQVFRNHIPCPRILKLIRRNK